MKLDLIKLVTEPVSIVSPSMGQIQQDTEMELIKNLKQEIIKNSNNNIIKTSASSDRNVELVDIFYKKNDWYTIELYQYAKISKGDSFDLVISHTINW
ncbi:subtilisin: serine protease [Mycoplasmopsis canis UF31]|uniref:hypothetical protein n=1 Tax=Mycoplasmopsis canis TaxID=29555 RepID=UPI00025AEC50|nr:hypothetical protein [Mycoplasmopsis canis]EIE41000.1 subtilisin: serine protease [Mycoplasmopsis canis UF31]